MVIVQVPWKLSRIELLHMYSSCLTDRLSTSPEVHLSVCILPNSFRYKIYIFLNVEKNSIGLS